MSEARQEETSDEEGRERKRRRRSHRTDRGKLEDLFRHMKTSEGRMCFVRYQEEGASLPDWYLVQVDLEKTDPVEAHQQGGYVCKWWIKYHDDSRKRKTKDCRFWPDMRQFDKDGVLT